MSVVITICSGILATAGLLCLLRVLRPGSIADRIIALDALLVVLVTGIGLGALTPRGRIFLDLLVVTSLLGFLGTITVARFIERRGA
jgi:multicomponent Na+:H+ antiporter subunit F